MRKHNANSRRDFFAVLDTAAQTQTAVMTLQPGQESAEKGNEHAQSDQVLYVIVGEIEAEIGAERATLHAGDVIIVPAGAPHRFRNGGKAPAQTLNVYAPPAY